MANVVRLLACVLGVMDLSFAYSTFNVHPLQLPLDVFFRNARLRFGNARRTALPRRSHHRDIRRDFGDSAHGHRSKRHEGVQLADPQRRTILNEGHTCSFRACA